MKKSKILLFLVMVFSIVMIGTKVKAETLPWLAFTFENHAVGDKADYQTSAELAGDETLQLYAFIGSGNEMCLENPDSCGWFVEEANLNDLVWESSNSDVAYVDNNGKITGISKGKATIYASNEEYGATFEVTVTSDGTLPKPDEGISSGDNTTTEPDGNDIATPDPDGNDVAIPEPDNTTTNPDDTTTTQNDIAPAPDNNNTKVETNNNNVAIIAAAAIGVLVIGIAIWYFTKNKKNG